jgi:cellulose synthase/poly-beta-1,6-N-acetylglucosamine synthase-like glycosyltransferase|tara:strand:- start:674 stop:1081 length:408 start_codon:yes stop_codon:yes gene_type:complete
MSQVIPELDAEGLRRFALIFALIVTGVFGVIVPLAAGRGFVWLPWLIGMVFATWGLLAPATVRPFYRLWMRFGLMMNYIISRVVLGIVFYLVVLPFAMVLRFRGADPLKRKWDPAAASYRVVSDAQDPAHMERPF